MRLRTAFRAVTIGVASILAFSTAASALAVDDLDSSSFIVESQFEPDMRTGAFTYSYPLTVPPGRNGVQPSLALSYSSANNDNASVVGYGWTLDIPSIERINRYGTDDLYDNHDFTSALSGELEDITLTDATHGSFGAKVDDGSFLEYDYATDETWTVTDKFGTTYVFGATDDARVSDPSDTSRVFRWMLSSITDANGNTVTYTYTKSGSQVYPSAINYTGNGATSGIFAISFTLESRTDAQTSYAAGFAVTTAYRIDRVDVAVSGTTARSYDLGYGTGDNGVRSLLTSVTETGYDDAGAATSLPATTFAYSSVDRDWDEDTSFGGLPVVIAGSGSGSLGVYLFDVNGDAYPDVVKSRDTDRAVYINNGDRTWTEDTSIAVPLAFSSSIGRDMGVRVLDMNGDGHQDLVYARYLSGPGTVDDAVYLNNGDGTGWTEDTTISVPQPFCNDGGTDFGVRVLDVDGDGMQDIVYARSGFTPAVYINDGDGTGWTEDPGYTVPVYFVTAYPKDMGVRTFDVNGDGLTDLVYSRYLSGGSHDEAVYINDGDGTGWTEDTTISVPIGFLTSAERDMGVRMMDVNGDGLTDLVYARNESSGAQDDALYINDGSGWTEDTSFVAVRTFTNDGGIDYGVRELDLDADGRDDILYSRNTGTTEEALDIADTGSSDLLSVITQHTGGTTTVGYGTVATYDGELFFPLTVVDTVTTDDDLGNTATTSYAYEDGDYYYADEYDRKFAGFGLVTVTDALGNVTKRYYHQGNDTQSTIGESTDDVSKLWHAFREEQHDDAGSLYRTVIHSITNTDLGNDRDFVYENQTLELLYDADSDHRDKATAFSYSTTTGNLSERTDYGLVTGTDAGGVTDSGTDLVRTSYTYADYTTGGTSGYATAEITRDYYSNRWRHTRWFYDNQAFGYLTTGNATTVSRWVSGTTSLDTTYTYNTYGMVATMADPSGKTTTYTYDSDNLYVATETDDLGYTTDFTYDYSSGKAVTMTDKNGYAYATDYDGLDRPTTEWAPDATTPTTLVPVKTYAYDDTSSPTSVHTTEYIDGTLTKETYTFMDGFGRPVQVRTESETPGTSTVVDTVYDALGRAAEVALPYESSGTAYTGATTDTTLYQTTEFDALGRVSSTTNVEGTATKSYEDWWTTEVDANGETKLYYYDAFDRLTTVGERLGTSTTYTTSYTWTAGGDLAKITDGASNIRQFSYDNMGRRTVARDLRSTTDGAYGSWSYAFDSSSNLSTSVSPNGVTTTYTYDDLNRVLTEDASSTTGTDVTYAYDTCTNGIGRLCSVVVQGGATTAYVYDALGRVDTETKTIDGTAYTTDYTYDRQGNVVGIAYPDGSETYYGFDDAGQIDEVMFNDGSAGGGFTVASGITYAPNGKMESVTYGNGVTTVWDYDAADLYRLDGMTTVSGATTLEDFTYAYDNVGNITSLVDASSLYAGMTIAYTYDDLYRLTQAAATSTDSALTYTKTWTYGAIGNILTSSDHGTYQYLGYQAGNYANPHAVTKIGTTTLTYDRNGNMTSDGTWTNTWNWRNEMTQSTNGTTTVSYQYDHEGNRVEQSSASRTVVYANSYYDIEGTELRRHIPAGSLGTIATSTYDSSDSTAETVYHHKDHLGGTHVETDSTGAVLEYIVYKPFGGVLSDVQSGTYENDYKYTGKELDPDTGYSYYGARYYMGTYGRFTSQDPVYLGMGSATPESVLRDPQVLNSYSYARNNPVSYIDVNGEFPWLVVLVVYVIIEATLTAIDTVDTAQTIFDPNATEDQKVQAFALYGLGFVLPGAGYSKIDDVVDGVKNATRAADNMKDIASRTRWADSSSLKRHVIDHGSDFGTDSAEDYAKMAQDFYQRGMADARSGIEVKVGQDGRIRMYNESTNIFGVYNPDGTTATFYKPDPADHGYATNREYWDSQK